MKVVCTNMGSSSISTKRPARNTSSSTIILTTLILMHNQRRNHARHSFVQRIQIRIFFVSGCRLVQLSFDAGGYED